MPESSRRRAIITGASSGIGEEFAMQLAPHMQEIIIVARRRDRLTLVRESLKKANPALEVTQIEADLSDGGQLHSFIERMLALPPASTLLVNNAGLGDYGEFTTAPWDRVEAMLTLNMATPTKLCHALIPYLTEHGGGIINMSSLASSLPIPDFAVYAASKSYVLSLSEALRLELKGTGVNVLAVCPGPVSTEFGKVARRPGFTGNMMPGRNAFDTPKQQVVSEALSAMAKGRARIYPSLKIRLSALLLAMTPVWVLRLIMGTRPRRTKVLEHTLPQ